MSRSDLSMSNQRLLWSRFWRDAAEFWRGSTAVEAWVLVSTLVIIVIAQLFVQYHLNYWNRYFFNALEQRDSAALKYQALMFLPLAGSAIALASMSVWGRMTAQRKWRERLTRHLINYWLQDGHYRRLNTVEVEHKNPEYRIAQDARMATDAPIDFAAAMLSSLLTAATFMEVLWSVGGDFDFVAFGVRIWVPAYLVIAVLVYCTAVTLLMIAVAGRLTQVVQKKNQNEAEMIAAANVLRETGEGVALADEESKERRRLWVALQLTLARWRDICRQLMRMTLVSQGNVVVAPIIGLVLCAPKYLNGAMSLGELTQAAAAFTTVQVSFSWLVDNYQRVADWHSAVNRVAVLLLAIDQLSHAEADHPDHPGPAHRAPHAPAGARTRGDHLSPQP
jgi:vitamin B12/bleomycin/antimicrobial peptide transport system ATP-binding/permease protein